MQSSTFACARIIYFTSRILRKRRQSIPDHQWLLEVRQGLIECLLDVGSNQYTSFYKSHPLPHCMNCSSSSIFFISSFLFRILSNLGSSFTPSLRYTVSAFLPDISESISLKNFSLSLFASIISSLNTSAVCNPALVPDSVLEPEVLPLRGGLKSGVFCRPFLGGLRSVDPLACSFYGLGRS